MTDVYNPLDKSNLAKSIETELLRREPIALKDAGAIQGAGVYVLYYCGPFNAYLPIRSDRIVFEKPIYIGKAIPKGGRKGGFTKDASSGRALATRLGQHATSLIEVKNLELEDFWILYLVVDDIWIPLGENMLIESFRPVWNWALDGFGVKDPGRRRATQFRSAWDVLHPGRQFAHKLAEGPVRAEFLLKRIEDYFAGRPMAQLPKEMAEQVEAETAMDEEAADEV